MKVASNLTALRATVPDAENFAKLLGYANPGDGGGGDWYYDAADTTTADNVATVVTSGSAGRWKRLLTGTELSVQWFGALGKTTGAPYADETAQLQAAFDFMTSTAGYVYEGKPTLVFPRGTWRITNQLVIGTGLGARGVRVRGQNVNHGLQGPNTVIVADFAAAATGTGAIIGTTGATTYRRTTITGLAGLNSTMEGSFLYFPAPANAANRGAWWITQVIGTTSCVVIGDHLDMVLVPESGVTWHITNKAAIVLKGAESMIQGITVIPGPGRVLHAGFSETTATSTVCLGNRFIECSATDGVTVVTDTTRHLVVGFIHADHPTQPGYSPFCVGSTYNGYGNTDKNSYEFCTVQGAVFAGFWTPSTSEQSYQTKYYRVSVKGYSQRNDYETRTGIYQLSGTAYISDSEFQSIRAAGVQQAGCVQLMMVDCLTEHVGRIIQAGNGDGAAGPQVTTLLGGRYSCHAFEGAVPERQGTKAARFENHGPVLIAGVSFDADATGQISASFEASGTQYLGTQGVFIANSFPNPDPIAPANGSLWGHVHTLLGNVGWKTDNTGSTYVADKVSALTGPTIGNFYPASINFGRAASTGAQWTPTSGAVSGVTYTDGDGGTTIVLDAAPGLAITGSVVLPSSPLDGQIVRIRDLNRSSVRRDYTVSGNGKNIEGSPTVSASNVGTQWFKFSALANEWRRTVRF